MRLLSLLVLAGLLAWAMPVMAEDGNNVIDELGDIFSGKGQTYAGVEINNIPLPIVPNALTLTAYADGMVGEIDEGVKRDIRGGVRLAVDWQKVFK